MGGERKGQHYLLGWDSENKRGLQRSPCPLGWSSWAAGRTRVDT